MWCMQRSAPRQRWGCGRRWGWQEETSSLLLTWAVAVSLPSDCICALALSANFQARPEHCMTKDSYLDAVFRGIADYYAASRRAQGALVVGMVQGLLAMCTVVPLV